MDVAIVEVVGLLLLGLSLFARRANPTSTII